MSEELTLKTSNLKSEIYSLRNKLQRLNEQKEAFFKQKEDLKKEIKKEIQDLKGIKSKKVLAQKALTESKEKKSKYSKELYDLFQEIKQLNQQKRNFFKKFDLRNSAEEIKEKINQLDESIETQAYTFDKEKKVMEQIKKLKKKYQDALQGSEILNKINQISKRIDELKGKTQNFDEKIRSELKETKDYEKFKEKITKINDLREKQHQSFQKFLEYKKEFLKTNSLLKERLMELNKTKSEIDKHFKERRKNELNTILSKKTRNIEEKIKKKQILTTEDLITFQGQK